MPVKLWLKAKRISDDHHLLFKILVFFFSVALMMLLSIRGAGSLIYYNGDSPLYISIADNFLDNGHFLQTSRDYENFIVPPGYPMILTLIRLFTRNDIAIAAVQYAVFGLMNVMLYCSERNFFGNIGGISNLMYCLMLWHIHYAGPGCVVTETWYACALVFCVWLLSRRDIQLQPKLTLMFAALFIGYLIRPVLLTALLPLCAVMLVMTVRKQYSAARLAVLFAAAVVIVGANGALNYRETGHFELSEGYSGMAVYVANNENVPVEDVLLYKSEYGYEDEQFLAVTGDDSLDYYEKNEIIGRLGRDYMLSHPLLTVRSTLVKLWYMFVSYWYYMIFIAAAGACFAIRLLPEFRSEFTAMLSVGGIMAVVTSLGLPEPRYTYALLPLYTLFSAAAFGFAFRRLPDILKAIPHNSRQKP